MPTHPAARLASTFVLRHFHEDGPGRIAVFEDVVEQDLLPEFVQSLAELVVHYGSLAHPNDLALTLEHLVLHTEGVDPPPGPDHS